eukprot:Gb_24769 [translate_table: standard]
MKKKHGNWVWVFTVGREWKSAGEGRVIRLPPMRGQIKKEIFASITRSVMWAVMEALNILKRRGRILSKRSHEVMALFMVYWCEKGGNSVGMDLSRAIMKATGNQTEALCFGMANVVCERAEKLHFQSFLPVLWSDRAD